MKEDTTNNESFKKRLMENLSDIVDPELGVDIVNLGLIYGVKLDDHGKCLITMTLTVAGCPLSSYLQNSIEDQAKRLPEVKEVEINLVWDPAWSIEKMSEQAKLDLGIY
ncbi:metal-sulfur cluster assembly factor [Oenococcus alcoholitolerans]|uniref:metal-sulfur cluster assembly factor n=1 Tax=Oenococcus alcoholitolerans TaxID=931074 RepID=UPI003F6F6DD4